MASGSADDDVPFELLPGEEFHIPLALLHQSALSTGTSTHHMITCHPLVILLHFFIQPSQSTMSSLSFNFTLHHIIHLLIK